MIRKFKKHIVIFLFLFLAIFCLKVIEAKKKQVKRGIVAGIVVVKKGKEKTPLVNATVILKGKSYLPNKREFKKIKKRTRTGERGEYSFKKIHVQGDYSVSVEKKGYIILQQDIALSRYKETTELNFTAYNAVRNRYIITTIAGNGKGGYCGDGGPATDACFRGSFALDIDSNNNLFIADSSNQVVRKIDSNGIINRIAGIVNSLTGSPEKGFSGDGGIASEAKLNVPTDIAVGPDGNLYIADYRNHRIRMIDTSGIITTFAGDGFEEDFGSGTFRGDGGLAAEASLNRPQGISVDNDGNLYIADTSNFRVRKVDTDGIINTIAGDGVESGEGRGTKKGDGGPAIDAGLYFPVDVVVDSDGNIFILDILGDVRKINKKGIINTVYGGTKEYFGEKVSARKKAGTISSITFHNGKVFVIGRSGLRMINNNSKIITIAGNGTSGFKGDDGPAIEARINGGGNFVIDSKGNIYISSGRRIRKLTPVNSK